MFTIAHNLGEGAIAIAAAVLARSEALLGFGFDSAVEAIRSLIGGEPPDASPVGIALTTASLIVMPILARNKRQVASGLHSRAGLADSAQAFACVYLSAVVLVGLLLNSLLGWWWADPVAALGIVVLLLNEGREALFDDND